MSLFAQRSCQKRFIQGPKGINFTTKRSEREKEESGKKKKTSVLSVFIPSTLEIVSE